jgi:hypothetical protein
MSAERRICRGPIDCVSKIDVEVRDHGLPLIGQVRGRREISLLDILQLTDQSLLGRASGARVILNCALVDHNCESETGMCFGFGHDQFRRIIDRIVGAVPIEDYAIDATADHIHDLVMNLDRIV